MRARAKAAVAGALATAAAASAAVAIAGGGGGSPSIHERLSGYQEDPAAISTTGTGTFDAMADAKGQEVTYRLSYSALEGTVAQAHIHFGTRHQSGGIAVFLCTQPGQRAGRHAALPAGAGDDHRHHPPGRRDRPVGPGHRRRRVRRAAGRGPRRRDLRQRPQLPAPGRARSARSCARAGTDPGGARACPRAHRPERQSSSRSSSSSATGPRRLQ